MKLKAKRVPYSSTVGGGIILAEETLAYRFQIAIMGTTQGITKEETDAIADPIVAYINTNGLEVPNR